MSLKEQVQAGLNSVKSALKALWDHNKLLISLVIAALAVAKYRDLLMNLIAAASKRLLKNTQEKSDKLTNQSNSLSQQADDLANKAKHEGDNKPSVDDDWFKK